MFVSVRLAVFVRAWRALVGHKKPVLGGKPITYTFNNKTILVRLSPTCEVYQALSYS